MGASTTTRILSLDVLRGIAILGTLATNIWIFTHPLAAIAVVQGDFGAAAARGFGEALLQQLSQGKFLGLLAIMFGIGIAIQRASATRAGRAWPGPYPWRMLLLLLDGLLHYLLVFEFDILMGYAVTGVVAAWVLTASEGSRRAWMWTAAALHAALIALITLALLGAGDRPPQAVAFNPYVDGSWWQLVELRIQHFAVFRAEAVLVFPLTLALFLAGARLYARGVLAPGGSALRKRLMIVGLGVALPLDLLIGMGGGYAGVIFARYATAPVVAFGLLAAVAEFYVRRGKLGVAGRWMADLGRVALSGYVLQNLIASAICYGWGLGLAARLPDAARAPATVALFFLVGGVVLLCARLWLQRFRYGPLEWLWHASYRRLAGLPVR